MTELTTNYNFPLPDFAIDPWHELYYQFVRAVDAALLAITGDIAFKGIWANSTAYIIGDRTVDSADGSVWICAVAHTSHATDTFTDDRTNNPTYWTAVGTQATFRSDWVTGTDYYVNDYVVESQKLYACNTAHTASAMFVTDSAYWDEIVDGTPDANSVTLAMLQQIQTVRFLGRATIGTGNVEEITGAQGRTILGIGSTTDNAALRANGTNGEIQGSGVTIDDSNVIFSLGLNVTGNSLITGVVGDSTAGGIKVPYGTDANRPTGANGIFRVSSSQVAAEAYYNSTWNQFAIVNGGQEFAGNQRPASQSPAHSASPTWSLSSGQVITPAVMTANVAIGLLQNCYLWEPFLFVMQMDGTGGYTLNMNAGFINQPASFVTAANKRQFIAGYVSAVSGGNMTEAVITSSFIEP